LSRKRLTSHPVSQPADVQAFFDEAARNYCESHGDALRLFRYRLQLLRALLPPKESGGLLVEIGCGPGQHLCALAEHFEHAIGLQRYWLRVRIQMPTLS
jgi:tRNA G46 methylase TrmB